MRNVYRDTGDSRYADWQAQQDRSTEADEPTWQERRAAKAADDRAERDHMRRRKPLEAQGWANLNLNPWATDL